MTHFRKTFFVVLLTIAFGASHISSVTSGEYSPEFIFTGEAAGDFFGEVSNAGDVNNDGITDFIVGALGNDAGGDLAGRAYVYSGLDGVLLYTFTGQNSDGLLGQSVSGAGDVNNDGFDDLIVGAPSFIAGPTSTNRGKAFVYSGQSGNILYTFTGEAAGDRFGLDVSSAGDVNNDGFGDVIIGANDNDAGGSTAGRAYVYSGQTGGLLYTFTGEAAGDLFGSAVSGAGDVDNDGVDDVIVGAQGSSAGASFGGRVYVYSGSTGAPIHIFTGTISLALLGESVSGAGDVNNDGFDDLIVGAPQFFTATAAGIANVYSGQNGDLLYAFTGEMNEDRFGDFVSGAGDVDNDGFDDMLVAASRNDAGGDNAGRVYVYSGQSGNLLCTFTGEAAGDELGDSRSGSMSSVGDINNDGFDDLIIGARGNDASGVDAGKAYVFVSVPASCCDTPGDYNDDTMFNIADVTAGIARIFSGGLAPVCQDEADANGDNAFNIADVTFGIARIFSGGPAPVCGTTGI